jgi:hypothetical protein
MSISVDQVVESYHHSLVVWGEECDRASDADPARGSHEFGMAEAFYSLLRDEPEGRVGIDALRGDANPYVRLMASAHSVPWASDDAVAVIEEVAHSTESPERLKRTAAGLLDAWRAGALGGVAAPVEGRA